MKKNKNVIIVEKDVQIAKGVFLSEGDALVKTRQGWTLIEAEGVESDEAEDEKEFEEFDDEDMDDEFEDEDEDEEVVEKKKRK